MSSSRLQSQPPVAASSEGASLAPWTPSHSLTELREALSSPGFVQAEVDALFAALARPPADDESPRARADFLQSLVELPEEARERTGSDGRTVRAAAVEALLEMGFPYALEVHPEVLEAVRLEAVRRKEGSRAQGVPGTGVALSLLAMVVQLGMLAVFTSPSTAHHSLSDEFTMIRMGLVVVPPLMAIFGGLTESRKLRTLGVIGMTVQGLVWLLVALLRASNMASLGLLLLVIPWYAPMVAAYLMREKSEPGDEAPSAPEAPEESS